ncbi:MAG: ATP-binding protein, partial [Thermoanaerobaculales bacterium]
TGLGLAIADRIITAHGGTLELVNRPGGGLIARATVPKAGKEVNS